MQRMRIFPVLMIAVFLASACGPRELTVSGAWARPAQAGGNSAVYFVIDNPGEGDSLTGASYEKASSAEIHLSKMEEGIMRMEMQQEVPVPVGGQVAFEPGGLHVMLVGLQADLNPGDTLEIRLSFEKAGEIVLQVPVEEK